MHERAGGSSPHVPHLSGIDVTPVMISPLPVFCMYGLRLEEAAADSEETRQI